MALETDKFGGFKVTLREELPVGAWLDTFSTRVPMWADLQNVRPGRLGVEKILGAGRVVEDSTSPGPIRGLLSKLVGTDRLLFYGDLTALYLYDSSDDSVTQVGAGYTGALDAGTTIWDSGSTVWDSGQTLWDDGAVPASLWSMVTLGDNVLATNGTNPPQIRTSNLTFQNLTDAVIEITITDPGTGYTVGDNITGTGGGGSGLTAFVSEIGGSGEILAVAINTGGSGYTSAPTLDFSAGTGTGATGVATIGTLAPLEVDTIQVFTVRGPHVIGLNTNNDSKEFIWCAAGDPTDWIPTPENSAGFQTIHELDTPIVAAELLGDQVLVYGEDQVFGISYVGAPFYFTYRPLVGGIGAVSKASVVSIGHRHIGLSRQGFFVTDGVSFQYIDEPQVRSFYDATKQDGQLSKTVGYHNEQYNEVRFTYPATGDDVQQQLCFNYETGQWYRADGPASYGLPRQLFAQPVIGTEDGRLLFYGNSDDQDGAAIAATATTKALDFSDADRVKEIDQLRIGFSGLGTGLRVRVGWSDTENGAPQFSAYQDVDPGYPMINTRVAGRWLTIEINSSSLNTNWRVTSIDVIGRLEGTR